VRDRDDDDRDERPRRRDDGDRPHRRREHDADRDRDHGPPYPSQLTIAGYLWIAFGLLILVSGVYFFIQLQNVPRGGAEAVGGTIGIILVALFGAIFIHVGIQSINGTARDTLGNGIGSLVLAMLQFGGAALLFNHGLTLRASLNCLCGAGLLIAGVLAILARADYLDWKKHNKGNRSSDAYFGKGRRQRDEED
jgi:hypothetical protein